MSDATSGGLINGEHSEHGPLRRWHATVLASVVGIAIGVLTLIGQGHLPGAWQHLANTGGPWLVGAFFIGALTPSSRWAAVAGLVTLLGALLGYYVAAHFLVEASASTDIVAFW